MQSGIESPRRRIDDYKATPAKSPAPPADHTANAFPETELGYAIFGTARLESRSSRLVFRLEGSGSAVGDRSRISAYCGRVRLPEPKRSKESMFERIRVGTARPSAGPITFLISGETAAQGVRRRLQRSAPGGTSRPALAAAGRTTPWAAEPDRTRPRSRPLQQIVIRGGRSGIPERGDERPPQATPFID